MPELSALVEASARAIGLAVALQSIELLQMRRACSDSGIWRFALLREEYRALPRPLRFVLSTLLPYRAFVVLLALRLVAAAALLAFDWRALLPFLFVTSLLVCVRFRGTFNGGSDSMTMIVLLGLNLAAFAPLPLLGAAGFGYIGVQALLSYFIAGLIKLKEPSWRNGEALARLSDAPQYAPPRRIAALLRRSLPRRLAAWSILGFECGFPLALVSPRACALWLGAGALFHVLNAALFGLNRFVFAWLAAYPALFWLSTLV